uniref:PUM-HD domain-containing protein n=1 Tax=Trypanosoma congolense (strain IL3000) TaxID=1068625 RepID=G0UK18_TRYCI|nr:conserved hypothetical protein [Trypanosoma congolense IL3000]
MGKTNVKRQEARAARLQGLPKSERLVKSARIKKREGRILDAAEKHALKMSSEYGEILRLWEILRTSVDSGKKEDQSDAVSTSVKEQKLNRYEYKYPTVDKLMKIIEPKFDSYIKTPRVSRVIQSMIKYASVKQLENIIRLVSTDFAAYATDAYGHFVVIALLRHAPHSLFDKMLTFTISAVPTLISHRFGIEVVHSAYSSSLCTAANRHLLVLAVFKDNVALMKHWKGYPVLEDVLNQEVEQRKRLLPKLFDLCEKLVSQKGAVDYPFVQRLAAAFVASGTKHEVMELCETMRPHLASLCTTREGARLVSLTFVLTEPKKRRELLRMFCDNLGVLAVNKYSAPVVARLFDVVYDVQLLCKYVVNDLVLHITQVINSPFGHQILLHLLTPHEERKKKFLLYNWFQHNLYSMENTRWNRHTWLTHEYKEEEIELCSKSALQTHLAVLPIIVKRFIEVVSDPETMSKLNKHYVGLVAREVLHVQEAVEEFKSVLQLSKKDIKLLSSLGPSKRSRESGDESAILEAEDTTTQRTPKDRKLKVARTSKPTVKSHVTEAEDEGDVRVREKKGSKKASPAGVPTGKPSKKSKKVPGKK